MKNKIFPLLLAAGLAAPVLVSAQSLWHDDIARSMVGDKRATKVGDIITIVVQETSTAAKNNETSTEKKSSWAASITSFLFPGWGASGGSMPAMNYSSDIAHDGKGSINNSQTIVAQVAVKVMDVLPNGSLVIEGHRETSFSGEKQTVVLRGVVRAEDVTAANTVLSYNIADATIQIVGKGTVTDAQSKGWFTRVVDKVNPF